MTGKRYGVFAENPSLVNHKEVTESEIAAARPTMAQVDFRVAGQDDVQNFLAAENNKSTDKTYTVRFVVTTDGSLVFGRSEATNPLCLLSMMNKGLQFETEQNALVTSSGQPVKNVCLSFGEVTFDKKSGKIVRLSEVGNGEITRNETQASKMTGDHFACALDAFRMNGFECGGRVTVQIGEVEKAPTNKSKAKHNTEVTLERTTIQVQPVQTSQVQIRSLIDDARVHEVRFRNQATKWGMGKQKAKVKADAINKAIQNLEQALASDDISQRFSSLEQAIDYKPSGQKDALSLREALNFKRTVKKSTLGNECLVKTQEMSQGPEKYIAEAETRESLNSSVLRAFITAEDIHKLKK